MSTSTQPPLRFTAKVTVEIEDHRQWTDALRETLQQAIKIIAPAVAVSKVREPVQARSVPEPVHISHTPPKDIPEEENLLLNTKKVAKLLDIGERTLWRYWNSGRILKPIKIDGTVRWNAIELRQWVEAGCPTHEKWVKMRE